MFATPVPSKGVVGETDPAHFGAALPIAGIAGDQQAALFGQTCFAPGEAKNTYGTGCFLLAEHRRDRRAGPRRPADDGRVGHRRGARSSRSRAAPSSPGRRCSGCATASASSRTRRRPRRWRPALPDNDGVYFVPAFTGLGAPHWDMYARGLLIGIERGTTRAHIARATLESIALQTRDLVEAMAAAGQPTRVLRADGGGTANRFLMQFQADVLGVPVEVAAIRETTALGAAFLAGLAVGVVEDAGRAAQGSARSRRATSRRCHLTSARTCTRHGSARSTDRADGPRQLRRLLLRDPLREVGHDPVDGPVAEGRDLLRIVHGPRVHAKRGGVRRADQILCHVGTLGVQRP